MESDIAAFPSPPATPLTRSPAAGSPSPDLTLSPQDLAPIVWLTARDPFTVVAHWDRAPDEPSAESSATPGVLRSGGRWWMRLHVDSAEGPVITERPAPEDSGTTLMPVLEPGRIYVAELGFESRRTGWQGVAISRQIHTPPDHRDPAAPGTAAEIIWAAPFQSPDPASPPRFIPVEPPPFIPEPTRWAWAWFLDGQPGTSESLAGSGPEISGQPSHPVPLSLTSSASPSSGESATTPSTHPERDFWMRINAEVILHGSTDPRASVTVAGHPIPLRSDGSFSFRFAFPDGQFSLPVTATAPDRLETREAVVRFHRETTLIGNVGEHPLPASNDPTLPL